MHTTIKFSRVKPEAKIPTKRVEDAGYDIYPCFEEDHMIILPHTTVMIPTGIASACNTDYCFILKERGSTGSKGLAQRCGVIDSGYRSEWFIPVTNTKDTPFVIVKERKVIDFEINGNYNIYPYEKAIAQALLIPVPTTNIEEVSYDELKAIPSSRGTGALGSSGK